MKGTDNEIHVHSTPEREVLSRALLNVEKFSQQRLYLSVTWSVNKGCFNHLLLSASYVPGILFATL